MGHRIRVRHRKSGKKMLHGEWGYVWLGNMVDLDNLTGDGTWGGAATGTSTSLLLNVDSVVNMVLNYCKSSSTRVMSLYNNGWGMGNDLCMSNNRLVCIKSWLNTSNTSNRVIHWRY